jgi:hypothetical protein
MAMQRRRSMFAVVVRSAISDFEKARQALHEMLPRLKNAPGFVAGYWLAPLDGTGISFLVFDSEDAAGEMLKTLHPGYKPSEWVTVEYSEVREVAGSA